MSKLLEIKNLKKNFVISRDFWGKANAYLQAVRSIDLELFRKETLAIVGESGSGKSTLARLILRLIDPDCGKIIFDGKDIVNIKKAELRILRQEFQMIFQNPLSSLDPKYTAYQSIAEPFIIHKQEDKLKEKVLDLIDLVDLPRSILDKYPHQCSGGQNQRINIARALALKPKLIVADEAVSALDKDTQKTILDLLNKLKHEYSISLLFITHDMDVVEKIADRVAVMYLGKIVEIGPKEKILTQAVHPYTKALLSAIPIKDPAQRNRDRILLEGELPKPSQIPSGCGFNTRCPFVIDRCKFTDPLLEGEEHKIACLRKEEL